MLMRTWLNDNAFRTFSEMERLVESLTGATRPAAPSAARYPALNIWEDQTNFYVEAELPGLSREQVNITTTADALVISGAREFQLPEGAEAIRRERPMGSFERSIPLPQNVDAERIEARLTDGVLVITMPKSEAAKPRRIAVAG